MCTLNTKVSPKILSRSQRGAAGVGGERPYGKNWILPHPTPTKIELEGFHRDKIFYFMIYALHSSPIIMAGCRDGWNGLWNPCLFTIIWSIGWQQRPVINWDVNVPLPLQTPSALSTYYRIVICSLFEHFAKTQLLIIRNWKQSCSWGCDSFRREEEWWRRGGGWGKILVPTWLWDLAPIVLPIDAEI